MYSKSRPKLTKYEIVRVLGARAHQLALGAPPTVDITGLSDAIEIAKKEYENGTIPLIIQREYPDGDVVDIDLSITCDNKFE